MSKGRGSARDPKATERELLDLLEQLLAKPGNGGAGEYAFMRQVRDASGLDAKRTFDAVAVGLWPSRGHDIHVYEVKVSRSDLLRELADPAKAEDAARVADRFSIVAPRDVVNLAELPGTWGLIHAIGGTEILEFLPAQTEGQLPRQVTRVEGRKLRVVRRAPLLHPGRRQPPPVPRSFLVPMLRAAGAVPDVVPATQQQIAAAVTAALTAERERAALDRRFQDERGLRAERILRALRGSVGVLLTEANVEEQAARIRAALAIADEPGQARRTALASLRRVADEMDRSLARIRDVLERGEADAQQMADAEAVARQGLGAEATA